MTGEEIERHLTVLLAAHRALDTEIGAWAFRPVLDEVELFRLKRRKLALKDSIAKLESMRIPDGVA